MPDHLFEPTVRSNVVQLRSPSTDWLSTGFDGGRQQADVAYNITVPEGWAETDLQTYVDTRLAETGFDTTGPALLTGVDQRHARRAILDPVEVVVTAGVSNPATLPPAAPRETQPSEAGFLPGTINIIAGTRRALPAGALANLVAVVTEAKTATLLRLTGFSGTTSDAVIVGSDPSGEEARFSGSSTAVGRAARACVRDALTAALESRYNSDGEAIPESVADAKYGCATTVEASVSEL